MLTIFTPTYNREKTLPRLFESLKKQTCFDFEWLILDDGSTDETRTLIDGWKNETLPFSIRYQRVDNEGKNRAVNKGVQMAKGMYFFIVDSDDFLLPDAVSYVLECFSKIPNNDKFIGISTIRGDLDRKPLKRKALIDENIGYVDCNNLERAKYNLTADMAEVFFTEKIKLYPFPVWEGEKFTPEAVIWDRMALDGYILRWYNKVVYLCEYQKEGLSASSWSLLRDNPMGYAMLFNIRLEYTQNVKNNINYVIQYISCCCLADQKEQIFKCAKPVLAMLLLPIGWIISLRRRKQIKEKCKQM